MGFGLVGAGERHLDQPFGRNLPWGLRFREERVRVWAQISRELVTGPPHLEFELWVVGFLVATAAIGGGAGHEGRVRVTGVHGASIGAARFPPSVFPTLTLACLSLAVHSPVQTLAVDGSSAVNSFSVAWARGRSEASHTGSSSSFSRQCPGAPVLRWRP